MKRTYSIAFCILLLSGLLLTIGTTLATETGYSIIEFYGGSIPTIDGKWGATEWSDAWLEKKFPAGTNARFAYKAAQPADQGITLYFIVEFPDTTNDAGDKWVICIDGGPDGGTAPNSNDNKIEITGHTTLQVYTGTGTGWAPANALNAAVKWNNSKTTSPNIATDHWVVEVELIKGSFSWGGSPPPEGLFVGMYDASNTAQGWVMWPPTSIDNPSRWGIIADYTGEPLPESLDFVVIVALSSVAVIVGSIYLRRKPKDAILTPMKL